MDPACRNTRYSPRDWSNSNHLHLAAHLVQPKMGILPEARNSGGVIRCVDIKGCGMTSQ